MSFEDWHPMRPTIRYAAAWCTALNEEKSRRFSCYSIPIIAGSSVVGRTADHLVPFGLVITCDVGSASWALFGARRLPEIAAVRGAAGGQRCGGWPPLQRVGLATTLDRGRGPREGHII